MCVYVCVFVCVRVKRHHCACTEFQAVIVIKRNIFYTPMRAVSGAAVGKVTHPQTSITETSYKGAELFVTNSKHYTKLSPVNYLRDSRLLTALQLSENCSFICGDD